MWEITCVKLINKISNAKKQKVNAQQLISFLCQYYLKRNQQNKLQQLGIAIKMSMIPRNKLKVKDIYSEINNQ